MTVRNVMHLGKERLFQDAKEKITYRHALVMSLNFTSTTFVDLVALVSRSLKGMSGFTIMNAPIFRTAVSILFHAFQPRP